MVIVLSLCSLCCLPKNDFRFFPLVYMYIKKTGFWHEKYCSIATFWICTLFSRNNPCKISFFKRHLLEIFCWTKTKETFCFTSVAWSQSGKQIVYIGYCGVKHNMQIHQGNTFEQKRDLVLFRALSTNISSIVLVYFACLPGGWELS